MKKLIPPLAVLLLSIGLSRAATPIYRAGNQFPAACGSSGQTISANGDCTTTWVAASSPSSLLSSTNTWSAGQTFTNGWTAGESTISSQQGLSIVGTGGTGRFVMENGFGGLNLSGLQYFTLANDSGRYCLGTGIDTCMRRYAAGRVQFTNITTTPASILASKVTLLTAIDPTTAVPDEAGQLAITSAFVLYVATGTGAGAWTKVGAQ